MISADLEPRLAGFMAAAQQGDAAAYQAMLRLCLPVIAATARGSGVPPDRVDDVVQEVLLTVHRARATYDPARPFLPWLRAIAQRRAIDMLRRHGRQRTREVYDPLAYEAHPDSGAEAAETVAHGERAGLLAQAVAALPEGQRQAVEHLALREQTLQEAAAETGRSSGALKVNLHRALKSLRTRMAGSAGSDV